MAAGEPAGEEAPVQARGPEEGAQQRQSDQAIGLGWRAARMRGIDGLGIAAEVLENPFNDRWRLAGANTA